MDPAQLLDLAMVHGPHADAQGPLAHLVAHVAAIATPLGAGAAVLWLWLRRSGAARRRAGAPGAARDS